MMAEGGLYFDIHLLYGVFLISQNDFSLKLKTKNKSNKQISLSGWTFLK